MSKRSIPNLPSITYPEMEYDDLLVAVNANRTRKVKLSDLFSAGYMHSTVNNFTANTQIGYTTDSDYATLYVGVGGVASDRKIVFGGNPANATDDNLVTSFGDIFVGDPFVFRTSAGDSSVWNDSANKVRLLDGTTNSILFTSESGDFVPAKIVDSASITVNHDIETNELSFSTLMSTELDGDLSIHRYWVSYDSAYEANSGISLSLENTLAICPFGHERYTEAIGDYAEGTTHVAGNALSVWGNAYFDGAIAVANTAGTLAGLGLGSIALQDFDDILVTGGYMSGVDIHAGDFESIGIDDDATTTTIRINDSNNVGIGTTTPTEKLHVAGRVKSTSAVVANTSGEGIVQTMSTSGSSLVVKGAETENYGIKLLCTTTNNGIWYTNNVPLRFYTNGVEKMKLSNDGHLSLGNVTSTPWAVLSCKGNEEAAKSSISLVNNRTIGDAYSSVYFGNKSVEAGSWVKVQHLQDGNDVTRMMFGLYGTSSPTGAEKMRINSDSTIEFKNSGEVTKMVWDGDEAELRIEGTKVWHEGNDGDGSGCDADLLDGEEGTWHRTWYNLINKPTLELTGDVTGSASFDIAEAASTVTITATVGDNSHRHNTTTLDGLDVVINDNITPVTILTKLKTVDGPGSELDADTCDGQHLGATASPTFNNLTITGTINETSDRRFKENIEPLENALDIINKLNGVSFNKISTPDKVEHGFIAQDVEAIVSEVVETDEEGYKSINYSRLTALLVEAIKELSKKIDNR